MEKKLVMYESESDSESGSSPARPAPRQVPGRPPDECDTDISSKSRGDDVQRFPAVQTAVPLPLGALPFSTSTCVSLLVPACGGGKGVPEPQVLPSMLVARGLPVLGATVSEVTTPVAAANLEDEWDSFEKLIGGSALQNDEAVASSAKESKEPGCLSGSMSCDPDDHPTGAKDSGVEVAESSDQSDGKAGGASGQDAPLPVAESVADSDSDYELEVNAYGTVIGRVRKVKAPKPAEPEPAVEVGAEEAADDEILLANLVPPSVKLVHSQKQVSTDGAKAGREDKASASEPTGKHKALKSSHDSDKDQGGCSMDDEGEAGDGRGAGRSAEKRPAKEMEKKGLAAISAEYRKSSNRVDGGSSNESSSSQDDSSDDEHRKERSRGVKRLSDHSGDSVSSDEDSEYSEEDPPDQSKATTSARKKQRASESPASSKSGSSASLSDTEQSRRPKDPSFSVRHKDTSSSARTKDTSSSARLQLPADKRLAQPTGRAAEKGTEAAGRVAESKRSDKQEMFVDKQEPSLDKRRGSQECASRRDRDDDRGAARLRDRPDERRADGRSDKYSEKSERSRHGLSGSSSRGKEQRGDRKDGRDEVRSASQERIRNKLLALAVAAAPAASEHSESKERSVKERKKSPSGHPRSPDRGVESSKHSHAHSRSPHRHASDHRHARPDKSSSKYRSSHERRKRRKGSPSGGHRHRSSHSPGGARGGSKHRRGHRRSSSRDRGGHARGDSPSHFKYRGGHRHGGKEQRRSRRHDGSPSGGGKAGGVKNQALNFKEQMKAQLLASAPTNTELLEHRFDPSALMQPNEKKSVLPLNSSNPFSSMLAGGAAERVTPQQALIQTMAAMHQKAQEMTGVAVPSYYNPAAVNPLKYAEQIKKRKLLWSKAGKDKDGEKEKEENKVQWTTSSFSADEDGKTAAKFRKLMGIKEEDQMLLADNIDISKLTEEQRARQEELFRQLDRDYAFARMTTHTHRGIGLGFSSQGMPDT